MKKVLQSTLLCSMLFIFYSCTKDTASPSTSSDNTATIVANGNWTVTSYTQRTEDKTSIFNGITFNFSSDGKLIASGTNSATGTWLVTPATTSYYSSSSSFATFTINLGSSNPFTKLTKIWNVLEQSNSTLRLDNREATEDEHITFSKK